jgi:hypothetical protein
VEVVASTKCLLACAESRGPQRKKSQGSPGAQCTNLLLIVFDTCGPSASIAYVRVGRDTFCSCYVIEFLRVLSQRPSYSWPVVASNPFEATLNQAMLEQLSFPITTTPRLAWDPLPSGAFVTSTTMAEYACKQILPKQVATT